MGLPVKKASKQFVYEENSVSKVEKGGYVPPSVKIRNMTNAGVKLAAIRELQFNPDDPMCENDLSYNPEKLELMDRLMKHKDRYQERMMGLRKQREEKAKKKAEEEYQAAIDKKVDEMVAQRLAQMAAKDTRL